MKRIPFILTAAAAAILCGEVGASSRTSHRPASHTSTRSSSRPTVHHRPSTHTPVRSVHPVTRQNLSRVSVNRLVNGPRRAAPAGFYTHAHRFGHGYWFRHRHACWGPRCWNAQYRCWCRWCPVTGCYYYWCGPNSCYYPVGYSPTGSYDYPEPADAGPPPDAPPPVDPSQDPASPEDPAAGTE